MNVRGLFPSLGAGGSLIAAALCALAVFGGVLAFQGESPGTAEANAGDVVVPGRTVRAQTSSPGLVSTAISLAAEARTVARAADPPRRAQARVSPRRSGGSTPAAPSPRANGPSTAPSTGGSDDPAGGGGIDPTPAPTPVPSAPTPEVPSGTVQRAVEQTRGAAQPVVDKLPPVAQAPVQDVADTVQDVAGTVDQTVDGVTGLVLPKP